MLHSFYAVTISGSVYEVKDKGESDIPVLQQLNGNPRSRFQGGAYVGIGRNHIVSFSPTSRCERCFEGMNAASFRGGTTPPVGLFLGLDAAGRCLASGDRKPFSTSFLKETCAVLDAIGNDHPVFVIGESVSALLAEHAR